VELWFSYILIRHEHSRRQVPFEPGWFIEPPPPARTREAALAIAEEVCAHAKAAPDAFPHLAMQYSEDIVTSANGGSVGGVSGGQLLADAMVLDAFAVLKPGEVSDVLGTKYGYAIVRRSPRPTETTISARRIVVPYDGDSSENGAAPVGRSRDAALAIARDAAGRVREDPRTFDDLLRRYSSREEVEKGGDIGVWTNLEPGLLHRERELLAATKIGEATDPIEGRDGFQVFVRTAIPPGDIEYDVQLLEVPYAEKPVPSVASRDDALKQVRSFIRTLAQAPDRFDALRRQYCCESTERWGKGRTRRNLVESVSGLSIGATTSTPIDTGSAIAVAKRLDPAQADDASITFDLPAPATVDVSAIAVISSGTAVQKLIRNLGDEASNALSLPQEAAQRVKTLHGDLAAAFGVSEQRETREHALASFDRELQVVLSTEQYRRYHDLAAERVSDRLMQGR
jgi:hypothetical protein